MKNKIIEATQKVKPKPPIKKKYIETPELLWELFCRYVEHEKANPMYKNEWNYAGKLVKTPLQVPITFEGFSCWVADENYIEDLGSYSANRDGRYSAYVPIIKRIRENCFSQNFKGASVGLFNANLIAKKLGLIEKTQQDTTIRLGKDAEEEKYE